MSAAKLECAIPVLSGNRKRAQCAFGTAIMLTMALFPSAAAATPKLIARIYGGSVEELQASSGRATWANMHSGARLRQQSIPNSAWK